MKYSIVRVHREKEILEYSTNIPAREYTEVLTIKGFKNKDKVPLERIITFDNYQVVAVLNALNTSSVAADYSYLMDTLS